MFAIVPGYYVRAFGAPVENDGIVNVAHAGRAVPLKWQVFDANGGPGRPVPGDHADDLVLGWSRDARSGLVRSSTEVPAQIDRIDLTTGARTHVREIMPPDRAGVMMVGVRRIINDGQHYSYDYCARPRRRSW